jgi:DUF917 family protein
MYSIKLAAALMAAAILFGCGGGGDPGIPLPKPKFTSVAIA